MNLSDDQLLETFLKENRPLHPRHSETESRKIWAKIRKQQSLSFWQIFELKKSIAASIAGLAILLAVLYQQRSPESLQANPVSKHELTLIEESMDLTFLENGELYEVSDLLSLSK